MSRKTKKQDAECVFYMLIAVINYTVILLNYNSIQHFIRL